MRGLLNVTFQLCCRGSFSNVSRLVVVGRNWRVFSLELFSSTSRILDRFLLINFLPGFYSTLHPSKFPEIRWDGEERNCFSAVSTQRPTWRFGAEFRRSPAATSFSRIVYRSSINCWYIGTTSFRRLVECFASSTWHGNHFIQPEQCDLSLTFSMRLNGSGKWHKMISEHWRVYPIKSMNLLI